MFATQLKYDLIMFSRELFYLVFTIIVPPVSYLFMGELFGNATYAGNLTYAETYTPSFILLISFGVTFFAFGFEQVVHRTTGVEKRILLSPVPQKVLLLSSIAKSVIITSFGYLLVTGIGLIVYDLPFRPVQYLLSYAVFIGLNALLLIISSALFSFFNSMNSALVFSIVSFQIVMITGGFSLPVAMMPKPIQLIAEINPLYHMNELFTGVWNGLPSDRSTLLSIAYLTAITVTCLLLLRRKKMVRN